MLEKERGPAGVAPYSRRHQPIQESQDATDRRLRREFGGFRGSLGVRLQGDGGEDEDLGLAGCGLDVTTA